MPARARPTLDRLARKERMRLMKFVCSFVWADLSVRPQEREFVERLVDRLSLSASERADVQAWLERPPAPESVDPFEIPRSQRRLFLRSIKEVIVADGEIAPEEQENLALLEDLLSS